MPTRNKRNKSARRRNYKRKSQRRQCRSRRYYKGGVMESLNDYTLEKFLEIPFKRYQLFTKPKVILEGEYNDDNKFRNSQQFSDTTKYIFEENRKDNTYKIIEKPVFIGNGRFNNDDEKKTFYETYINNSLVDVRVNT